MRKSIRGLVISAVAGFASLTMSESAVAANVWSSNMPVQGIIALEDGGVLLIFNASNPACGSSGNQFYVRAGVNGQTDAGVKVVLSLAITAYTMGKNVSVYFDSAIPTCSVRQLHLVL